MKRRSLIALALLAAACGGGGGTAPTNPIETGLTAGRYQLTVIAPAGLQGCQSPWEQTFVSTRTVTLALVRDGSEWVGRPEFSFAGDVALRLRETPVNRREVAVSGAIQGAAVIARGSSDTIALGVSFATATPVSGRVAAGHGAGLGTIAGSVVFIDLQRAPMTCASAEWTLNPITF
jgi:hypothetical protein